MNRKPAPQGMPPQGGMPPQQQRPQGMPPQQQQMPQMMGRPAQPSPAITKKAAPIVLSQIPNISSKVLNLTSIREQSKRELGEALSIIKGPKALVMDPKIIGLLNLIVDPQFLISNGTERNYELKPGRLDTQSANIIYIIRPKIKYMHIIKEHIQRHLDDGFKKNYGIIYIPRSTILAQRVLEEEGVAGNIEATYELPLDIVPFDEDVLSLELPTAYKEFLLEGDRTSLFYVAKSLMKLQSMFGTIPVVKGKGQCSRLVMDLITRMRKEMGEECTVPPEIDSLILIDRDVDLITPMCTQLTYEGLIDEFFNIRNNAVYLDEDLVNPPPTKEGAPPPPPSEKKVPFPLHSNDKVYSDIRDINFSVLSGILNKKAKDIDDYYKRFKDSQSPAAMRDFVKNFPQNQAQHNSLRIHTSVFERILEITKTPAFSKRIECEQNLLAGLYQEEVDKYLEECINKKAPWYKILRLLILYSLTHNGIKPKQLELFKREIVQSYGCELILTLANLERIGLLKKQESRSTFPALRRDLNLITEEINENNPTDMGYVYSGYTPLSCRLVQHAIRPNGWKAIEETLRSLPGPTFEEVQPLPQGAMSNVKNDRKPITLVYFIGGVTFAEISALRFLSRQDQANRDFIVVTTKLINGDSLVDNLVDKLEDD
ncbi:hypothetical protein SAMD00019534_109810 [Acytostelium subglobosum LB1]|uniref:hypothetical protein n=1 Tax=Acytostelium subglobosum LB1 TaxID=1410327 RepID=UPI000644A95B|nr:hypothetical protein SAMD00019534_109810 [Acytostelium subglobosum LB1]GAM27805.1 hypothetical protein SAMD00019534_109810 [Acytostelium subglobosum LB1]|eukprot:XP_012749088.1 hypothetical protein SAMD00019534_109810 [Acytostelium subglobosum LB1]